MLNNEAAVASGRREGSTFPKVFTGNTGHVPQQVCGGSRFLLGGNKDLEHHAIETIFHELLVHGHEPGDEGLEVVDGLVAQLQPVLIVGSQVSHLCLQLPVAVVQQLCEQTLSEHWISTTVVSELQMSQYLHDDVGRDAVCQQLVQTGSHLQQPGTRRVPHTITFGNHSNKLQRQSGLDPFARTLLPLRALLADDGISRFPEVDHPVCHWDFLVCRERVPVR